MGPITAILPVPRVVPCGGRMVKVSELRLRDLAVLQSYLDELEPDPLTAAQQASRGLPEREQLRIFGEAYDRAEAGPPIYGDARGKAYFATPEGSALFLWVALSRHRKITPVEAAELYHAASPAEYGRIWRIAHGITSLEAISRILLPLPPSGGGVPGRTWPEMIVELSEARGWTLHYIYNLTLSEWIFARNGGATPEIERAILPGEDLCAIVAEQQRRLGIID